MRHSAWDAWHWGHDADGDGEGCTPLGECKECKVTSKTRVSSQAGGSGADANMHQMSHWGICDSPIALGTPGDHEIDVARRHLRPCLSFGCNYLLSCFRYLEQYVARL